MAQPDRNAISSEQYRVRRFLSVQTLPERTDSSYLARADVHELCWLSTLRGALQRTRLERMLHSPAIPLLARSAGVLERRTCNHLRSDPQRRRVAPGRDGAAPIDERIARTRLRRIRRACHQLWWMDRGAACDGRARSAFRRLDGTNRKHRSRNLGESCSAVDPPRTAWCEYRAFSRRTPFSSELTDPQRAGMRPDARIVCCRRIRFDRATRTARGDPAKVVR